MEDPRFVATSNIDAFGLLLASGVAFLRLCQHGVQAYLSRYEDTSLHTQRSSDLHW